MEPYANNLGVAANTGPRPLVCLKQNQRSLCWRKSLTPTCLPATSVPITKLLGQLIDV